ncbi:MAG: FAD-dependent monooxygenase, partial [Hyphomicrobium sp.]
MPSETPRFDVVISGASFGGLALACGLSRALGLDFKIALIDRVAQSAASPKADSRASALSAASKRMLEVLDIWPLVADVAQPVTGIEITDSTLETGVRPVLLTYDNVTADGEPATYIVPNSALQAALRRGVESSSSLELITPAEAIDFASNESGIEVTLADGGAIAASLLVAAEGRRSRLREAAGIKVVGWSYPQTGIVVTVRHDRPHGGRAVQHFLPSGPFAILPLTGNRSCITWTEDAVEAKRILALDDADFLAEVDKRFGGKLGALSLDGPRQSWPLEMHLARRYVGPRFALIGDAAHGVHPIAGQGLNLAFRDVAALVEVLSDAIRLGFDAGDAQALVRYERWRRFDSTISAATFDGLNRLFSSDRTLVRSGREFGLGLVDRMPMLKRFFVGEAAGLTGELPRLLKGEPV